ncbi:PAS domain-containing protein [Anaerosporobacter faecicola]|uniref:PAS domain-containing protein n=1 Tax=Anaerosporobacter faecicola TaxID=2718714 RepID=UPI00143A3F9D|nr:PAS domain-containing protein [Anaerosporobacter faecicola]
MVITMKASEKIRYQQFVDVIDFPTVIFVFETRRIIAINKRGREILSPSGKILRYMPENKLRPFVIEQVYGEQTDILMDMPITIENRNIRIDFEINSFELDKKHISIIVFDYTDKQSFGDKFSSHVPRLFWKDKRLKLRGANHFCREDFKESNLEFEDITSTYDQEVEELLFENEMRVIKEKESIWNVMQLIQYRNNSTKFINMSRIPIINKNGTVIGLLGVYNLMLTQEEFEKENEWLKKEKWRLTKLLALNESVFMRIRVDENWSVEFVTSNVEKWGYNKKQFYIREVCFRDLIAAEDKNLLLNKFIQVKRKNTSKVEFEFRVRKADGSNVWVKAQTVFIDSDNWRVSDQYVDFILTDISDIKSLQKELRESIGIIKAKVDRVKQGKIPVRYVRFSDLFDVEELETIIKNYATGMKLSCAVTDYMGRLVCDAVWQETITKRCREFYEERRGRDYFRELFKKTKEYENSYVMQYDEEHQLYIYAFPFIVDEKCVGLLHLFTEKELDEDAPVIQCMIAMVNQVSKGVVKNIELLRLKDKTERQELEIEDMRRKKKFLNEQLELALTSDNLYETIGQLIQNASQYIYIGEILLFRQIRQMDHYVKNFEWTNEGRGISNLSPKSESLDLLKCSELLRVFLDKKIVVYNEGEIPPYIQKQLRIRMFRSVVFMLFDQNMEENVMLVIGDPTGKQNWSEKKVIFLSEMYKVVKVIIDRIQAKKNIEYHNRANKK